MKKELKRTYYMYPSGFDKAFSDAVEERVAKVEEALLFESADFIQQ